MPSKIPPPPWRTRSFATVTEPAGLDDLAAKELLLSAFEAVDHLATLAEVAAHFGVASRTLLRARAWLETHDPASYARLRPRVSMLELDPVAFVARRHDRRAKAAREP